jgi:thiamine kinase-like enzyme
MEMAQVEALARRLPQLASATEIGIDFLAGGITNRNYRLLANGEAFVIRVPGANTELLGIDRTREAYNHCTAASAGIAPDAIGFIMPEGCLVTRFVRGEKISREQLRTPDRIHDVCRSLHAIHDGLDFAGSFSPFRTVENYLATAQVRNAQLPGDVEELSALPREIERALYHRAPLRPRPIHADLLNENFIDDGEAIRILDWEYAGMADIYFDLANLADHHDFEEGGERTLLKEYFGVFRMSDAARLMLMRIMSEYREAMWGVVQRSISTLDFDFAGYSNGFYERVRRMAGDPGYREWLRSAADVGE